MISEEVAEKLLPKFSRKADEMGQHILAVANGTIEQLHHLVKLVASNEVSIIYKLIISMNKIMRLYVRTSFWFSNSYFYFYRSIYMMVLCKKR